MSRNAIWAVFLIGVSSTSASAQISFTESMLPKRAALERLGLEKQWAAVVPLGYGTEQVLALSLAEDMLFAQTSQANLHAFQAETGRLLWSANLGTHVAALALPAAVNSDRVFVTNDRALFCLDRGTGRQVFKVELEKLAASPTAADEERVIVGLSDGKLVAYSVRDHSRDKPPGRSAGQFLWAWKTPKPITGRPIPAGRVVAFASQDSRVYVAQIRTELTLPAELLYRFLTGGPVKGSMATMGTRTLLVPSTDHNLYAVDLFEGKSLWVYSMGAPIEQEPLAAGNEVFVGNVDGLFASLNAETGERNWDVQAGKARFLALSPSRVYAFAGTRDLVILDRATGQMLADPRATTQRAGLELRDYSLVLPNRLNDRMYLATNSGVVVCLREAGRLQPTPLRDPSQPYFGYIPDEAPAETPPENPEAAPAP